MINYDRIPQELKALPQWLVWRYELRNENEKPTKVPFNPGNGHKASVSDPTTWVSFEQAVAAHHARIGYDGIGFVFTVNDPYCGIDFDETDPEIPEDFERQKQIFDFLNSYSEYSPSGKGIHTIVRATVPHGRKRSNIEVYSSERYFTFTGNVFHDSPIMDRQQEVGMVWAQMGDSAKPVYYAGDIAQLASDEEIWHRAANAANGDLFQRLWNGDWTGYRPNNSGTASSEADFALIDILAFYTRNRMQIQRMFQASALGKRDKYKRINLIGYMINKSFDNMLPDVDLSALTDKVNAALAGQRPQEVAGSLSSASLAGPGIDSVVPVSPAVPAAPIPVPGADSYTVDGLRTDIWKNVPPPGLMGEIARWIYDQSVRPVYEYSLAGAIGFMAGLAGRAYNVSNTGLNLYLMALGETGTGKEAIASGIDKLVDAVKQRAPIAGSLVGPGRISSGQALLKNLAAAPVPCYLSIAGEFGIRLKQITGPYANDAESTLLSVLLDLYHKSGQGRSVKPTIYSDKANNTDEIYSPAFTMLGETVPSTFFQALDESAISSGLLPRFLNIEYTGPRVPMNHNHEFVEPPAFLVTKIEQLFMSIHDRMQKGDVVNVTYDRDAAEQLRYLDTYSDNRINAATHDVTRHIWNRFHLKVLKVAALVSVGTNPFMPVIDRPTVDWATSLVLQDIMRLTHKFEAGEIGMKQNSAKTQDDEIKRIWREYVSKPYHEIASYPGANSGMHNDRVISRAYLTTRARVTAPFRTYGNNQVSFIPAFNQVMKNLIDNGTIQQLPKQQAQQSYGTGGDCYAILDTKWLFSN